jgi:hypothetical protein
MMTPRRYFTARPSTRCFISMHLHSGSGGLDAETFCGAQLAGEFFLLTSLFIEPFRGRLRIDLKEKFTLGRGRL